jgi:CheY-like chemotaxis protein
VGERRRARVLVVDDDLPLCQVVEAVLADEGYAVATLHVVEPDAVRTAVGRLEPDCVLLDGEGPAGYGREWDDAAWLTARGRRVPVVMFTASQAAAREGAEHASARSRAAGFSGVLNKPFDLDELMALVEQAVGEATPFDRSTAAEAARTRALVGALTAAGGRVVHASTRREWVNFEAPDGAVVVLYWSQRDGVYYVTREAAGRGGFEPVGRFYDRETAVLFAVSVRGAPWTPPPAPEGEPPPAP